MDYLTRALNKSALQAQFGFHPLCKQLRLVNLCFAGDLVFCKAHLPTLRIITDTIKEFSNVTSVEDNPNKS